MHLSYHHDLLLFFEPCIPFIFIHKPNLSLHQSPPPPPSSLYPPLPPPLDDGDDDQDDDDG